MEVFLLCDCLIIPDASSIRSTPEKLGVLPLDMVDNSSSLCKSSLDQFFRQSGVQTGHLTLD